MTSSPEDAARLDVWVSRRPGFRSRRVGDERPARWLDTEMSASDVIAALVHEGIRLEEVRREAASLETEFMTMVSAAGI